MSKVYKRGTSKIAQSAITLSFDPRNGWQTQTAFTGPLDEAYQYARTLAGYGIPCQVSKDRSPLATVTILNNASSDPEGNTTNEVPVDSWQLLGNEVQKSIYEHPRWLFANAIYANNKAMALNVDGKWSLDQMLRYNIQGYLAASAQLQKYPPYPTPAGATDDQIFAWNLFDGTGPGKIGVGVFSVNLQAVYTEFQNLAIKGQEHFAVDSYVLRHTQTVSANYAGDMIELNPECLYTTRQLVAECTDGLAFPIPQRLVNRLVSIPEPLAVDGYLWSWRKLPATESTAANRKVEITVDYALDQWSTSLYQPL